jgi:alkanesulfonate monooxygenase SsuD/methylene tetrahydromethanopterin reductase-like flavin-dependent oxidoreductase (luciferase family)
LPRQLDQPAAARQRHRHPARVLEGRHGVDELRPPALPLELVEQLLEGIDPHSVRVDRHLTRVGLIGAEDRHRAGVGGALGDHHVAGIDQRLGDQIEGLLAAAGDDHVLAVRPHPLDAHHLADHVLGSLEALGRPILQRLG